MFQKYIGFVPQENPLWRSCRQEIILNSGTVIQEETWTQTYKRCSCSVRRSEYLDKRVDKLSGGMKKRLSICCALAKNPPVLILDEPGASLDIVCKQDIMNYLSAYTKSGGTVIITSHEEGELKLADRMYLLKNGKLNELDHPVTGNELLEIIHR
ncbi:MAG: ATP-binding cassette domain-containing protein [Lachnospira eligens]